MLTRTKKIAIASTTAGLLVVGGTSYALGAASSSTKISACYATKTGDLRYLKSGSCKAGEKKIAWNVKGATGAKGAKGAAGSDGADGAVVSALGTGPQGTSLTSDGAVVATVTITMPSAGNVVANAVATLEADGGTGSAACYFRTDGSGAIGTSSAITTVSPAIIDAPLVATTRFALPAGESTVEWFCYRQSQGDTLVYNPSITLLATQ